MTPIIHKGVVALALLLAFSSASALTEEERQAKLEALRATIEQVQKELDNVKSNRSDIMKALEDSESKMGELNEKVKKLQSELDNKQSHLKTLRQDKEALSHVKKQQSQAASAQLNAAYRLGNQSSIKLLLNQKSPGDVTRNLKYFDYIVRARNAKITALVDTLTTLNQLEPRIASEVDAISAKTLRLEREQDHLKAQQQARQKSLTQLEALLRQHGVRLEALQQDQSQLQTVVTRVASAARAIAPMEPGKPFSALKGKLPWPPDGRVLTSFGSERVKGKMRWQGVLIGAEAGAPVRAVASGRVVFSNYLRGHGLLIIVDHGAGFMTLYAHNQNLYKQLGDWVESGEQVASVGLSGGQKNAGLYFELRHNGEPTNPHGWLKRA